MQRFISFLECLSAPSSDSFHSLALATEFSFHDSVPGFSNTMMTRRVAVVMASSLLVFLSVVAVVVLFSPPGFRSVLSSGHGSTGPSSFKSDAGNNNNNNTLSATHRKLLLRDTAMEEPNRMWGEKCSKADILINQGPTAPLPSGIPTYTVEIMNVCVTGCDISGIHLSCGWFSSARLVNPRVFKRLHYNDCLVNDGKPLVNGGTLSFQYANTFLYPLKVSAVHCH